VRMMSSSLYISVEHHMCSRCNEAVGKTYKLLSCESEQCENDTALGCATAPSLNLLERPRICSNYDKSYY
jgi:hypothetical protein